VSDRVGHLAELSEEKFGYASFTPEGFASVLHA
jgi:hypothetical protein